MGFPPLLLLLLILLLYVSALCLLCGFVSVSCIQCLNRLSNRKIPLAHKWNNCLLPFKLREQNDSICDSNEISYVCLSLGTN